MHSESGDTRSVWMDAPAPEYPPLSGDTDAEVCVLGAGIAGLSVAHTLVREGRRVIVLDAAEVGSGETGRTTAHLSDALDDRYTELERVHGQEGARLAAESHRAAIDRIESNVREEGIDCGFARIEGYLFADSDSEPDVLRQELAAARRAGLTDVHLSEVTLLRRSRAALRFPRQGQFHPLRYLHGLARAVTSNGGTICTHTRALEVHDGHPARVRTDTGHVVTAQSIVVATNSPISDRLAIHTKQAPYRSFAISIPITNGTVLEGLFWDTEDPYHYVRTHTNAEGRRVLIVGGEDHKTGQANDAAARFDRLERWAREHFAGLGAVEQRWSGQVMEPVDHLGFIGRDPASRHVYIASGDSGHGMTHGTIAGMLIPDLIGGRPNPWAQIYRPDRKSVRTLGTYTKENLNVARMFGDYLRPGEVEDPAEIEPGHAGLVRRGAKLLAVYRDEDGALMSRSAVCTHIGCIVHWNAIEKSWDCPCHGSRFGVDGEVLNGPARAPLAAAPLEDQPPSAPLGSPTQRRARRPSVGK